MDLVTRSRVRDSSLDSNYSGYCCFVDGSWKVSDKFSGTGWFCISSSGEPPTMGAANLRRSLSPLHIEVEALLWAMKCMIGADNQELVFFTDCSDLMKMVSFPTEWPVFSVYLDDFQSDKEEFSTFSLSLISRSLIMSKTRRNNNQDGEQQVGVPNLQMEAFLGEMRRLMRVEMDDVHERMDRVQEEGFMELFWRFPAEVRDWVGQDGGSLSGNLMRMFGSVSTCSWVVSQRRKRRPRLIDYGANANCRFTRGVTSIPIKLRGGVSLLQVRIILRSSANSLADLLAICSVMPTWLGNGRSIRLRDSDALGSSPPSPRLVWEGEVVPSRICKMDEWMVEKRIDQAMERNVNLPPPPVAGPAVTDMPNLGMELGRRVLAKLQGTTGMFSKEFCIKISCIGEHLMGDLNSTGSGAWLMRKELVVVGAWSALRFSHRTPYTPLQKVESLWRVFPGSCD
ncbi:Ribonuclease H domain [Arabidopsis suecica]|uniref:Ribonuclease H domain n=1 Tax=Arabidopsis suecica TaxID=45249 RepID=A0A8T2BR46_ARASU|nr:Ribonuclease H domain [Arabidopsis suecica]